MGIIGTLRVSMHTELPWIRLRMEVGSWGNHRKRSLDFHILNIHLCEQSSRNRRHQRMTLVWVPKIDYLSYLQAISRRPSGVVVSGVTTMASGVATFVVSHNSLIPLQSLL